MSRKQNIVKKIKSLCYLTLGGSISYQLIYFKKDFYGYYDNVLQPLSQRLSPELAHKIGVSAIKYGLFPSESYDDPHVLKTKFLNYEISNPIGIAAGFDKHGDAVVGLRNLGFSVVEIGSVTPEPQPGNPKPRVFRLPEDYAVINRYGFNSEGHNAVYNKIQSFDKALLNKGLLGINLGKNKLSDDAVNDYTLGIKKFIDIADYFVINVSSPNTPGLRSLQSKEELKNLLVAINKTRNSLQTRNNPPLLLKLAPDLSLEEMKDIVSVITQSESQVQGLIISNTTIDRSSLSNKEFSNETGGLSGKPLNSKSTEMIKIMYNLTQGKVPIIGVGGVFSGQDAYEKILAGASIVQIYTALIYHGPPVITKIKSELVELLKRDGYVSVNDAIGKGAKDAACRIEILEFISNQLQSGALPLDQEAIKGVKQLAAGTDGERSDRAWLALMTRLRSQRDHSLVSFREVIQRPRVLWRIDALLDRHENVLEQFFKIENPSSLDIDELFEYILSRFEVDDTIKVRLQPHLQSVIKLRPQASASIIKDHYENSIAAVLGDLDGEIALKFGECLLNMACLKGDAAAIYLRKLCASRPSEARNFLKNSAGIVRPEDALEIVKEVGPRDAEPICLEATGDHSGALDALLVLIALNDDSKTRYVAEACDLCVRVSPTVPPDVSAGLWTRLLRRVDEVPTSLLFEAIAYLPVDELLVKTCDSPRVALTILGSGAGRLRVWECTRRIAEREKHDALATALAAARRGVAVRGKCRRCGERLASRTAARTAHCTRTFHTDCDIEATCQACGKRVPTDVFVLPPLSRRLTAAPPQERPLLLIAPPRPDLEGVA